MRKILMLTGIALAAGCTGTLNEVAAVPQGTAIGEPQNCINRSQIRDSRIRDDSTIDFVVRGREVYRNILPNACNGLAIANSFRMSPRSSELCSVDTITVVSPDGSPGNTCLLGKFQRLELPNRS